MRATLTIAGLLLAAVAVGFYWYSQRGMKLSETDSILIGEFSNAAGDPVFDGTLREALHALGVAAADLRGKFGEEPDSLQKFDLPLERATTASLDALAAFTEGRRLAREKGAIEAVAALKKAVELDPKFALAHSNLAVAYYNLNQNALAADHIRRAFEAADRQTVRDRLRSEE